MSKVLDIITGLVILWVIYLGIFNIVASGGGSTAELQEAQLWTGIGFLSIGIGLVLVLLKLMRR